MRGTKTSNCQLRVQFNVAFRNSRSEHCFRVNDFHDIYRTLLGFFSNGLGQHHGICSFKDIVKSHFHAKFIVYK